MSTVLTAHSYMPFCATPARTAPDVRACIYCGVLKKISPINDTLPVTVYLKASATGFKLLFDEPTCIHRTVP